MGENTNVQRTLHFDLETGTLHVKDEFDVPVHWEVKENLISRFKPEIQGNAFVLKGETKCCSVECRQGKNLTVLPMEHHEHDGSVVTVYLMQWEVSKFEIRETEFTVEVFV